ncbi:MAG: hypothetical protein ABI353_22070 [Isosphaeraceae bacterium]
MVFTNYSGCTGQFLTDALYHQAYKCIIAPEKIAQNDGCFNDVSPIRFASVRVGLRRVRRTARRRPASILAESTS